MVTASSTESKKTSKYSIINRAQQAEAARMVIEEKKTQLEVAEEYGVSRDAVQGWTSRSKGLQSYIDPKVTAFYESPQGLSHLHRTVVSACLVFHSTGGCGLPLLQKFLELSKLSAFIGSSIGSLYNMSNQMTQQLLAFGKQERERMAKDMSLKEMTAAVDENFIMQSMTLILMEPESGFILAEQPEDQRDAVTWIKVSQVATNGLNVKIVQVTGDEASGITKYATELLGAEKSPDLFHVQQPITRGLTSVLARRIQQAEKALNDSIEEKKAKMAKLKSILQKTGATFDNPTQQVVKIAKQLLKEERNEQKCQQKLEQSKQDYKTAQTARRAITSCYHPYDLSTGEMRSPEKLKQELEGAHAILEEVSKRVGCTEGQKKNLSKAKGAIESMVQTLAFFFRHLLQIIQGLHLDEQSKKAFELPQSSN
jgi:hypothetical protein